MARRKSVNWIGYGLLLVLVGAAGGCLELAPPKTLAGTGQGRYRIVTTCGMVKDIVQVVAGDRAVVSALMGEGVDPHLYKPTRNDVRQLVEADVVFYAGLSLEGRMTETFRQLRRRGKRVVAVTDALDRRVLHESESLAGHYDPHVWMDVSLWSQCVTTVAQELSLHDPSHADQYQGRAREYQLQLKSLHEYARAAISSIPPQQRVLITAHDAFGYFSEAYDIPVRAAQGLSTESEAGVSDINQLVDLIVSRRIPAIFVESSVSEKNIRAILEGAADRGWHVRLGGELFSDAMGPPGTYEGTYIGMIDHNVTVITRALGGRAPRGGFQGRLATGDSIDGSFAGK